MKKYFFLLLLGLFMLGCTESNGPSQDAAASAAPSVQAPEAMVEISLPDSLKTGEEFQGSVTARPPSGDSLFLYYDFHDENLDNECVQRSIVSMTLTSGVNYCKKYSNGMTTIKRFDKPGVYTLTVEAYSCREIKDSIAKDEITAHFGTDCGDAETDEVREKLAPVFVAEKSVAVTGEAIELECEGPEGCTQQCSGCKSGSYSCDVRNGVCLQCNDNNRDCASGYNCEENKCIKAVKSCNDLGGKDCSGCMGQMLRATDTDTCCVGTCLK
ncbi:MAG: hypothetical protein V1834_02630 [Candidatus Micrarchaeota archaeon]